MNISIGGAARAITLAFIALALTLAPGLGAAQSGGASNCAGLMSASCLQKLGAGAIAAAPDCADQLTAYRSCLADLAAAAPDDGGASDPLAPPTLRRVTIEGPEPLGLAEDAKIHIEYPQFAGSGLTHERKMNEYLKAATGLYDLDINMVDYHVGYKVEWLTDELISVWYSIGFYRRGAAHPGDSIEALNFAFDTGERFEFRDLFRSGWEERVNALVKAKLDARYDAHTFESVRPDQPFGVNGTYLTILFQRYEAAPGYVGSMEARLTVAELRDLLNPNGPLGFMR